jgi:flagellar biosynthesis protein FliR
VQHLLYTEVRLLRVDHLGYLLRQVAANFNIAVSLALAVVFSGLFLALTLGLMGRRMHGQHYRR